MAQVKKLQTGTGSEGIQPKKLQFKVNGSAYEKDEQFLRDQFEPIFTEMVTAGNAKARDKDLWQKSYAQYMNQAKAGTYSIETSGDKFMSGSFSGAPTAELGTNADGSTARKSRVGEIISPRTRSDEQRMSLLNTMIGNRLAGAWQADTAAAKAKADADKLKAEGDHRSQALKGLTNFHKGFGFNRFGDDFNTAKELTLNKYWEKGVSDNQRRAMLMEANTNILRGVFNPELDKYKDDEDVKALLNGRTLDEVRGMANKVYDPKSGNFLYTPKTLSDFHKFSNITDTMGLDNLFYDRKAWEAEKSKAAGITTGTEGGTSTTPTPAAVQLKKAGNNFTDGKRTFTDKEGKKLANGIVGGILYNNGEVYHGAYIGNDEGGAQDYEAPTTGYYWDGKPINQKAYEAQYNALLAKGDETKVLRGLLDQRNNYVADFYKGRFAGKGGGGATHNFVRADEIQDKDASDYIFSDYGKHNNFSSAKNLTGNFKGFPGAIALVRNDKVKDNFGNAKTEVVVRLKGTGKTYNGRIVKDYASGKYKMLDRTGKVINEVTEHLRNATYDATSPALTNFRYNWEPNSEADVQRTQSAVQSPAAKNVVKEYKKTYGQVTMDKEGGVIEKNQFGGTVKLGGISTPKVHKQATVKDIGTAIGSNYELSTLDKVELGALAGDLAGVVASFTGAGSVVSGTLGIGSTIAQGIVDYQRDGEMSGGDWAALGTGLALDAASFIPGLATVSSSNKVLRGLTKSAKVLVPLLTAAGLSSAAMTISDVAMGKKKMTDLSVDDLRSLVNGIHAAVGGTRMIGQRLATKQDVSHYLTLKSGKQVPISKADALSLDNADDKVELAKSIIKRNRPDMALEDIVLGDTKKMQLKLWKGRKTVEDSDATVTASTNGRVLKDLDDYKGNSLWDKYMKGNINRAAKRDASLDKKGVNANAFAFDPESMDIGATNARKGWQNMSFGMLGDYTRKNGKNIDESTLTKALDDRFNAAGKATSTKMSADRADKLEPGLLEQPTLPKLNFPFSKGYVSYKRGGVVKLQNGKFIPYRDAKPYTANNGTPLLSAGIGNEVPNWNNILDNAIMDRSLKASATTPQIGSALPRINFDKIIQPGQTINDVYGPKKTTAIGADNLTPGRKGIGQTLTDLTSGIDPLNASELARALYTRSLNSRIDTRVERPMLQTPQEISVPVRGNLLGKNAYDQQADTVRLQANNNRTSDAMLNTASNLAASQQEAQLRTQGAMVNNESLERTKAASLENQMRTSSVRTEVANQNMQTNARATQAERQANNEKQARMAQPILDYWKNTNYEGMIRREQNRSIDGQLFQIGEQNKVQPQMASLEAQNNAIDMKLYNSPNLSDSERAELVKQQTLINSQYQQLATKLQQAMLMYRRQPGFSTNGGYYSNTPLVKQTPVQAASVSFNKEGGAVKMAVEQSKQDGKRSVETSKQQASMIKEGLDDDTKRSVQAMKQIQELIKLALS